MCSQKVSGKAFSMSPMAVLILLLLTSLFFAGVFIFPKFESGIARATQGEATVVIKGKIGASNYYSPYETGLDRGFAYVAEFPNQTTMQVVFPGDLGLKSNSVLRVKFVRSPFRNGVFIVEYKNGHAMPPNSLNTP